MRKSISLPGSGLCSAVLLGSLGLLVLLGGCARDRDLEFRERAFTRVYTPQVPTFLNGPAGALLTNSTGYSAHATVQGDSAFFQEKPVEGELLCRGSKLLFAPKNLETSEKNKAAKGFAYIWDVATGHGMVLSDALQGYAPVSSSLLATGTVTTAVGSQYNQNVIVQMNDGSKAVFHITGTRNGVPSEIKGFENPPLSVTISKIRTEVPSADVFAAPAGFSQYNTPAALADELAARQQNLRRNAPLMRESYGTPEMFGR